MRGSAPTESFNRDGQNRDVTNDSHILASCLRLHSTIVRDTIVRDTIVRD